MPAFVYNRENQRSFFVLDLPVAAAVAIVLVFGSMEAAKNHLDARDLDPLAHFLLIGSGFLLAVVRRFPLVALAGTVAAFVVYVARGYPEGAEWVPGLIAIGGSSAAGYRPAAVGVSLSLMAWMIAYRLADGTDAVLSPETLLAVIGISSALFAGEWARTRRDYIASTIQRAELAELTKEEEARHRVNEERLRIAREMHDVLAHSLASINVQAGVTLHVLHKHPAQAEEALKSIKAASAEALRELRSTLGALRDGGPKPTRLADIDALVEPASSAGLEVHVRTDGDPYDLPSDVDLAAYRILQESVTNAIRYAGPATLTITLAYERERLSICVEDNGRGRGTVPAHDGTGSGISGMRDRALALGGTLEAGPRPESGFRIRAVIPTNGSAS